jgi:hypothetical protein
MSPTPWLPKPLPWASPDYTDDVIAAIRQVEQGKANEAQQKLFWRYLMYVTSATEEFQDLSFRPDDRGGQRATDFAEGKRFVGLMIRKLLRPEYTSKPHAPITPTTVQKRLRQRRADKIV